MRRGRPPILLGVCLVGLLLTPHLAGAHNREPQRILISYWAHDFDPLHHTPDFAMDANPPRADEHPNGTTDLDSAGDPKITYNFTATPPLPQELLLATATPGNFLVWIKAVQGVPVPGTKVTHFLRTQSGTLVGEATQTKDVAASSEPLKFDVSFSPRVDRLPAGTVLRWTMEITMTAAGAANAYNPAGAPYGVSRQYPFVVNFTQEVIPPPVPMVRVEAAQAVVTAAPGGLAVFALTVHNDADEADNVTLVADGLPPGADASFRDATDRTTNRVSLGGGTNTPVALRITGLSSEPASHALRVSVQSDLGAQLTLNLTIEVKPVAPMSSGAKDSPAPSLALFALVVLAALRAGRRRSEG